jgi:hypothetical protein
MPHVLSITDGTTTLPLSTAPAMLQHYAPKTPQLDDANQFEPVGETAELLLYGANTAAVRTAHNALEAMLLTARRRAVSGVGPRVFLLYQPIGDAAAWRSEVLAGEAKLGRNAMTAFGQAKMPVSLLIERVPWWEGARAQIPLANGNGSNNTAGLTVWMREDGTGTGRDNWTDIAAGAVGGVLPAPLEVHMRNTSGAGRSYAHFHLANNVFAPALSHFLEGEARSNGAGAVVADAACSNGNLLRLTGVSLYCTWALPAALLGATAGRYMRILARFRNYTGAAPIYARAEVRDYYGLVTLARTPYEVRLGVEESHVQDLGLLPLPPGGFSSGWAQNTLALFLRSDSSATVDLDYIQLTPADELCYRHIEQRGMVVAANDWIVDDGIEGLQYLIEGGANHPIYTQHTLPLHVFPGVAQRLYFLHDGPDTSANWTLSVKAFYRPRRLTI